MGIISADLHGTAGQGGCNQVCGSDSFGLVDRVVVNQDTLILIVNAHQAESDIGIQICMRLLCNVVRHILCINSCKTYNLRLGGLGQRLCLGFGVTGH